ncbi:MAG: hypothetical protein Q4B71_05745 [Cardiobacteriaceae bacterium]|nr:hypothetical protein [Cardiobacteriaceae bacterium]
MSVSFYVIHTMTLGGIGLLLFGWIYRHKRRTLALWLQAIGALLQYKSALLAEQHLGEMSVFLWLVQTVFLLMILALWQNARYMAHLAWLLGIINIGVAFKLSPWIGWVYGVAMLGCLLWVLENKQWRSRRLLALALGLWLLMIGWQSALMV